MVNKSFSEAFHLQAMNKKLAYLFGCQVVEKPPEYWCLFFNKWLREDPSAAITVPAFLSSGIKQLENGGKKHVFKEKKISFYKLPAF